MGNVIKGLAPGALPAVAIGTQKQEVTPSRRRLDQTGQSSDLSVKGLVSFRLRNDAAHQEEDDRYPVQMNPSMAADPG